jgi:hypothetical protein
MLAVDEAPRGAGWSARRRDRWYRRVTWLLAAGLFPVAYLVAPGRARWVAGRWALAARFPAQELSGLTPATRAAFDSARTLALWRDGELVGLTSGYRPAEDQARLFAAAVRRYGSSTAARRWVLPPGESRHASAGRPTRASAPPRPPALTWLTSL